MRVDIDSYREILDTLTRNKSRSFLTGFGVFWGVFMLVALMGGGNGLKEMLNSNFAGFATNSAIVWSRPTTKVYKGFRKGRWWSMEYKDVERLRNRVPELDVITPVLYGNSSSAYYGDRKSSINVSGVEPDYRKIQDPMLFYGRYINDMDIKTIQAKVNEAVDKRYYNYAYNYVLYDTSTIQKDKIREQLIFFYSIDTDTARYRVALDLGRNNQVKGVTITRYD